MAKKIEQRSLAVSLRAAAGNEFELVGMALAYNVLSQDLGGFREQIAPGAFTKCLATNPDVKCLLNHDANIVLGRTTSGTLTLNDSQTGLNFLCRLDPAQQAHRDVYAAVKRGDISECSFAFKVEDGGEDYTHATDDESGKTFVRRTVRSAKLFDVSAVTYPAYSAKGATSVQARSADYRAPRLKEAPVTWAALRAQANRQEYEILRDAAGFRTIWTIDAQGNHIPKVHAMSEREIDERNRERVERLGYTVRTEELRAEIAQLNRELGIID